MLFIGFQTENKETSAVHENTKRKWRAKGVLERKKDAKVIHDTCPLKKKIIFKGANWRQERSRVYVATQKDA